MKINEFKKYIREEISNILKEIDSDIKNLPAEAPADYSPEYIAKYIQPAITPDMDYARIINLIGHALTRYFSNDKHYRGKEKIVVWNYLNSERHEDYVPDVMDELLKLGVKWTRETSIKEYVTSNNELEILLNAAEDINVKFFNSRGKIDNNNYRMAVRETADKVLDILESNTKVIKKTRGFTASEDQEREYYQLPEFNVSISLSSYKVSRATIIQFLDFDGEKPISDKMYQQ